MTAPFPPPKASVTSVVLINDHGWISGGQAKIAIDTALQLRARGLEVCFVAGMGPADPRLVEAGCDVRIAGDHDLMSDPNRARAAAKGIWNAKAARLLSDCLAGRDPASTVIHVHGWAKALSPSIGPVITGSSLAHVYTLHEYFLACPNGGFFDYRKREICHRRPLGPSCLKTRCDTRADHHKLWRVARQAVLWSAGRMPSGLRELIYLTPEQRDILGPYMPDEARWHFLPNPAGDRPAGRINAEANRDFLFIGRFSPEKGAVTAARAARIANVPIAFCGEGEDHDAILAANPDARILGWLSQEDVIRQMRSARCLLFPSLWYETYGLVVADALRLGLPVIVSESSVAASMVDDGRSGQLVAAGDENGWAEAMTRLRDDALTRSQSEAAFQKGAGLPDWNAHMSRLTEIYSSAVSRKWAQEHSEAVR